MPIKGISDRRRLVRVGKIRLGVKKKSAKGAEYPSAVDYFVCKEDASTPAESAAAFKEVYGACECADPTKHQDGCSRPRELDIVFPVDDPGLFADPNFKMYGASWGLICRGDGETAMAKWDAAQDGQRPEGLEGGTWANKDTQSWLYRTIPCLAEKCPMQASEKPLCKAVMNLQFMLPRVRGIGVWQIDTGSWNSIRAVLDSVELVKAITGGRVRGLPLTLRLVPKEVIPANVAGGGVAEGSRGSIKKKTVQVLSVSLPGVTLPEMLAEAAKLPEHALLPAPETVDEEEVPVDMFPAAATGEEGPNEASPVEDEVATDPPAADDDGVMIEPAKAKNEKPVLTLGELLNRCHTEFGVDRPGVLEVLGVESVEKILNFQEAFERVKVAAT